MAVKKSNSRLPKEIIILGVKVAVDEDPTMSEDEYGETLLEKRTIKINPKHKELYLSTFWHEVIHFSLGVSGQAFMLDEKQEEAIVRALEHALEPYLKLPE